MIESNHPIDRAPDRYADLIPWLDSLPFRRFQRVWVGLVMENVMDISPRMTARLLVYVRQRYGREVKPKVQRTGCGGKLSFDDALLRTLYRNGMAARTIAEHLECSYEPVRKRLKQLGVSRQPSNHSNKAGQ